MDEQGKKEVSCWCGAGATSSNAEPQWLRAAADASDKQIAIKKKMREAFDSVSKKTGEDKMQALCFLFANAQLRAERSEKESKARSVEYDKLHKSRQGLAREYDELMLVKLKLEGVCKELQQKNELIKEDSAARTAESDRISNQVRKSIADVQQQMELGRERSERLATENTHMASKLEMLTKEYEARSKHVERQAQAHDIEKKLFAAKLEASDLMQKKMAEENEKLQILCAERQEQLRLSAEVEKSLREQITVYTTKYETLHSSLNESNSAFEKFKKEMERMNNRLVKVQKEAHQWRRQCEDALSILEKERAVGQAKNDKIAMLTTKVTTLEQLCRALRKHMGTGTEPTADGQAAEEGKAEQDGVGGESAAPVRTEGASDDNENCITPTIACDNAPVSVAQV